MKQVTCYTDRDYQTLALVAAQLVAHEMSPAAAVDKALEIWDRLCHRIEQRHQ